MTDKAKALQAALLAARQKAHGDINAPARPSLRIELSANRADDDEPWRLARVGEAFGMMVARWAAIREITMRDAREELVEHFSEWRDHKGQLHVYMRKAVPGFMSLMIRQAWEGCCETIIIYHRGERDTPGCAELPRASAF
ncbi:hypothetical protein HH800_06905 [Sphingobium yanoikuyae]|uniref:Uncharacterized protein n=1 Tax=Sphingobium yanoikuyae TaxID=13690 RepID=A0A6M4G3N0_SPHYA|nr:hypothetical protein [Sphingobium yanoikuyae]QJR01952.1 hypothetical protein HH800_06905 [Sphingobium yanoikuyae]